MDMNLAWLPWGDEVFAFHGPKIEVRQVDIDLNSKLCWSYAASFQAIHFMQILLRTYIN